MSEDGGTGNAHGSDHGSAVGRGFCGQAYLSALRAVESEMPPLPPLANLIAGVTAAECVALADACCERREFDRAVEAYRRVLPTDSPLPPAHRLRCRPLMQGTAVLLRSIQLTAALPYSSV